MNSKRSKRKELEERRISLSEKREINWQDLQIEKYADAPYMTADQAGKILFDEIRFDRPLLIGRLGETELRTIRLMKDDFLKFDDLRHATYDICINAGFFPRKIGAISRFCKLYSEAAMSADYMGILLWQDEEYFLSSSNELKGCFSAALLDPLKEEASTWISALEGKKVLVISPFAESIKMQYKKKDILFSEGIEIPRFNLITLKAVQSIGGCGADGFKSWFEALEYMKKQIDVCEFDIALLGCGAYGMPLGAYIKSIGKKAVYVGGCLQLMFGIIGKRWEDADYVKKHFNENWVRPDMTEVPKLSSKVEDGCYW